MTNAAPARVLMLANLFQLPYRVLRSAAAAGAKVFILGGAQARDLTHSRYCAGFTASNEIDGGYSDLLASEVNRLCQALNIDVVIPGDAPSTRSLIAIRPQLKTRCFPLPTLEQFDFLNDKWKFASLCDELGIPHPHSRLYPDRAAVEAAFKAQEILYPSIAKPLSLDGGVGCVILDNASTMQARLQQIDYQPIIVQDFIVGSDIGASVFCEGSAIKAFIAHELERGTYTAFADPAIMSQIARIVGSLHVDGVFNFDMRRAPDGAVTYLECNPRFFYKIALSMLAGINFVQLGLSSNAQELPATVPDGTVLQFPKALLASILAPQRRNAINFKLLFYLLQDPIPYLRERMGLE